MRSSWPGEATLPAATLYLFCLCAWQCYCLIIIIILSLIQAHVGRIRFSAYWFSAALRVSYYPGGRDNEDHQTNTHNAKNKNDNNIHRLQRSGVY